jgi:L,D-transpeptidase YbiS
MINREFSDKSTGTTPANGYKPVMIVDTIDHPATKSGFKNKFLATMKFIFRLFIWISGLILFFVLVAGFLLFGISEIQDRKISNSLAAFVNLSDEENVNAISNEISSADKKISGYNKQLLLLLPKTPYIIINTTDNEFQLYSGNNLLREGKCSTGKNTILQKSADKKWVFKTPRGAMRIRGKTTAPVWVKPDWAFIEEGLPVPSARHSSRYEYGSLGDYAMTLGDGYMIHGTLYKRLLGMPVTHGCIRLNDEDLEFVFSTLSIGSKVYIY